MSATAVTFKCGACGKLMSAAAQFCGRPVRCPHCQQVVQVPVPVGAALGAAAAAPSAPFQPIPSDQDAPAEDPLQHLAIEIQPAVTDSIHAAAESLPDDLFGDAPPPAPVVPVDEPPAEQSGPFKNLAENHRTAPPVAESPSQESPWSNLPGSPGAATPEVNAAPAPAAESVPSVGSNPWANQTQGAAASPAVATPPSTENPWEATSLAETPAADEETHKPAAAAPPPMRPRQKLPLSIWALAFLLPYALAITTVAVVLYMRANGRGQDRIVHPLESMGDQGLYEDFQEGRRREIIVPTEELPANVPPLKLNETRTFGGLEVTPLEVTRQKLPYAFYRGTTGYVGEEEALVLRVKLKNVSDVIFHPMDPTFNRAYRKDSPSYSFLQIGTSRYYGAVDDPTKEQLKGQSFQELRPGEEMETLFIALAEAPPASGKAAEAIKKAPAEEKVTWRLHLRKGRETIRRRAVWVTTVVPVAFSPGDVKEGKKPAPAKDAE